MNHHTTMTGGVQLTVPEEVIREFDLKPGDTLVIRREDGKIVIKPYSQVVREVQARMRAMLPPDYEGSLVDELLADRREQARRENEETERWSRPDPS